ncbi:DnaB-like helicase N-terminal domain-containing protein [Corynebacterium bovis]|uniref:DnaB-like helicase N-terminal domain-containing protein n=1 Tax=Corynebacterium bovis TaxID=36808 RepID=UPI0031397BF9
MMENAVNGQIDSLACDEPTAPGPEAPAGVDAEAMLLSCLLWTDDVPVGDVAYVLDYLHPKDFFSPYSGALFGVMRTLAGEGRVVSAGEVARWVGQHPEGADVTWPGGACEVMVADLAGLGGVPAAVVYWADEVLGRSYRRQFTAATTYLSQVGQSAPEADLFDILAEVGAAQRRAKARRDGFLPGLPGGGQADQDRRVQARGELAEMFAAVAGITAHTKRRKDADTTIAGGYAA